MCSSDLVRNLELIDSLAEDGKSLLDVIDRTVSPMGARMLRRWLLFPLKDVKAINGRLDIVEHFFRNPDDREELKSLLERIGDLERLVSKVAAGRITPREVVQVKLALQAITPIKEICTSSGLAALSAIGHQLNPCPEIAARIARELRDDAPNTTARGDVIASGIDTELEDRKSVV